LRIAVPLVLLCLAAPPARAASVRAARAEALYQRAQKDLDHNGIDGRRQALRELEQASLDAPRRADIALLLARTYYRCGFLKSARERFEQVVALDPADADGQLGLAQVWMRDWLKYLDPTSFDRALAHVTSASRLRPDRAEVWLMLVPLQIEHHDVAAATAAAERAYAADSSRPEALLALAATAWRRGEATRSESLFAQAIPRLRRSVRERFEDIAPVASMSDTMTLRHLPAAARPEFLRRFWLDNDPDPASPENEARLEYWARVAQAYFLYYDAHRREWDERGELYVRYGPPSHSTYNPVTGNLNVWFGNGPNYPANLLVWDYPEMGMSVTMQDRLLSEYYLLPMSLDHDMDPVPDPDSLARHAEAMPTSGGRGVFPRLPPGVQPLPVEAVVSRFETPQGGRVLAQLVAPATSDSAWAEWVVVDSARAIVRRATQPLAPSPCDPSESDRERVAEFEAELPPGLYTVGLAVHSGLRRGAVRIPAELAGAAAGLALSDIVLACGPPDVRGNPAGEPSVHLPVNTSRRVGPGAALGAYLEIYHLATGADGLAHFSYEYTVRSAERDTRIWIQRLVSPRPQPPPLEARREETNLGATRRQYISEAVQSLPPGRYRLEINVRDLVAGTQAKAGVEFVREGAPK
jgi:GWxTD domain-containing protein